MEVDLFWRFKGLFVTTVLTVPGCQSRGRLVSWFECMSQRPAPRSPFSKINALNFDWSAPQSLMTQLQRRFKQPLRALCSRLKAILFNALHKITSEDRRRVTKFASLVSASLPGIVRMWGQRDTHKILWYFEHVFYITNRSTNCQDTKDRQTWRISLDIKPTKQNLY